jgi:hypothetical protein
MGGYGLLMVKKQHASFSKLEKIEMDTLPMMMS